jgi:hypothetical protein
MDESRHLTAEYAENSEKFAEILGALCVSVVENSGNSVVVQLEFTRLLGGSKIPRVRSE